MTSIKTKYVTYVDSIATGKNAGRVIYVGKGNLGRFKNPTRNKKHRAIIKKYGLNRQIALETDDETEALNKEISLIAEYHTYHKDPLAHKTACNFTLGGEGAKMGVGEHPFSGGEIQRKMWAEFTPEERSKILSDRNVKHWECLTDKEYEERCKNAYRSTGYKHTEDAKEAIRNGNKGKKKPGTSKGLIGNKHTLGYKHKIASLKKLSDSIKVWWAKKRLEQGCSRPGDEILLNHHC